MVKNNLEAKIDKIYDLASENNKQIAVMIEHMKTLNNRTTKNESNYESVSGTLIEHDETLHDLCNWKDNMKEGQVRFDRWGMTVFGIFLTFIFSVVMLALKVFWGV